MLSGGPPFSCDDSVPPVELRNNRKLVMLGMYWPLEDAWTNISESAKELVIRMLDTSPERRISVADILRHPWLAGAAPENRLGDEYVCRVRNLALRHRLKKFFVDNDIENKTRITRERWEVHKRARYETDVSDESLAAVPSPTTDKFVRVKKLLIDHLTAAIVSESTAQDASESAAVPVPARCFDMVTFCKFMNDAGMAEFACEGAFNVFDVNRDQRVELKDVLLILVSLSSPSLDQDAASLYFRLFDVDNDGYISKSGLKLIVPCVLQENSMSLPLPTIEAMFDAIDRDGNGKIDLAEFKSFYNTVLLNTRGMSSAQSIHTSKSTNN